MTKVLSVCTDNAGRSQMAEATRSNCAYSTRSSIASTPSAPTTRHTNFRLAHLLPGLREQFPELPGEQIRGVADAVLSEFADVPVRSFVMPLAERKARELLAAETRALRA